MKNAKLKKYFSMLRARHEVMDIINGKSRLKSTFYSWDEAEREEFLDFCTGQKPLAYITLPFVVGTCKRLF